MPASKPGGSDALAAEERPAALVETAHGTARLAGAVPLDLPPVHPVAPCFQETYDGAALLPTTEFVEPALECRQLECAPVAASELTLRHTCEIPLFQPSQAAMQLEPEPEPAASPMAIGADGLPAEPAAVGAGPALLAGPAPADCPQPIVACASDAPARLAGQPAQISVPALASGIGAQPGLAPEMVSGISHEQAANPAAAPQSHGALRPSFWSSVRIKNWKLRITFAKPA